MTQQEKYESICDMPSIDSLTNNEYPTFSAFKKALREGRVAGDYKEQISIVSNNPREQYKFLNQEQ